MTSKPKAAILMFSPTIREARVMRQIAALRGCTELYVLGMGKNPFPDDPSVRFVELPADNKSLPAKVFRRGALYATVLGGLAPALDVWRYSRRPCWQHAFAWLIENRMDVLFAHELDTAALAVKVKARHGTKIIMDLHEYSPRESDDKLSFRLVKAPHIVRTLKKWVRQADATTTVNEDFADPYVKLCGIPRPVTIHNMPARLPDPRPEKINDGRIHLIHHGMCSPARMPHLTLEALQHAPEHIVIHFMFVNPDPAYLQHLHEMAQQLPGRVIFEEPVNYTEILPVIARYHAGIYFSPNTHFNHTFMLPNKFFDFVCAGLPVIIGPNASMGRFTKENGFGWITEDFDPKTLGKLLSQLTPESIAEKAAKANGFSHRMNAVTEHEKLVRLMEEVLAKT